MQDPNLELIITLVSIIGAVLAAFGFLHREMRRGFERVDRRLQDVDRKFDQMDKKFDGLRTDVGAVQVSVARIEGHLGLVAPAPTAPRAGSEPPERAA